MPVIAGHDKLASIPEERISDKISRKVMSRQAGHDGVVALRGRRARGGPPHPHEQISWMIKGPHGSAHRR
jgi:hypothetical protein